MEKNMKKMKKKEEKKADTMLTKYKRKREEGLDEKIERERKRNHPGYLEWTCEFLANDQADLCNIFNHSASLYIKHSKTFEQIVYERD
jgi:hypothetical protein